MSWSRLKKQWCCAHKSAGCKPADAAALPVHLLASFRNDTANGTGANATAPAANATAPAAPAAAASNDTANSTTNTSAAPVTNATNVSAAVNASAEASATNSPADIFTPVHPMANTTAWAHAIVNHSAVPSLMEDTLSEVAMEAAKPAFDDMDCITKDGVITVDEAATFGTKTGVPWGEIKPIFDAIDMNKDHKITRQEFDGAKPVSRAMMQDMRAGFQDIDLDGNNLINSEEWLAFCDGWMVPKLSSEACTKLFAAADVSVPHGSIDRTEFEGAGQTGNPAAALLAAKRKTRGVVLTLVRSSLRRSHPGIKFLGVERN